MNCFQPSNPNHSNSNVDSQQEQAIALGLTDNHKRRGTYIQRRGKYYLLTRFSRITGGSIQIDDADDSRSIGVSDRESSDHLSVKLDVFDPSFYIRTLLGGTIGSAESYMDGQWMASDLTNLIRILVRNIESITSLDRTWSSIQKMGHWLLHKLRRNTVAGSRKNIHQHYDLGNEFYQLFLDPTMNYSSGIFPGDGSNMLHSSLFKMNWICEKLQLKSDDHVVEIGTGWGGLACFMAKHYGCQVTTTTISRQQFEFAQSQVKAAGLSDRVNVLLKDYRDLDGKFDKLVSVEMIEAVGHQYFDQYFHKCNNVLKDDGLMLLQGITMSQQNYQAHLKNVDFIRRYIFPGGCLPSIVGIGESIGRTGDMRIVHLEDITTHYEKTLQQWRYQFFKNIARVRELGYDDRFIRMWHFYLCYCEAAFAERRVNTVQMVMAKPSSNVDPANEYSRIGATSFDFGALHEFEKADARNLSASRNNPKCNPSVSN